MKVHQLPENMRGEPCISEGDPDTSYLGRIIIELWEQPAADDEPAYAYAYENPDNINQLDWLRFLIKGLQRLTTQLEDLEKSL
jgi:hypothetical protein